MNKIFKLTVIAFILVVFSFACAKKEVVKKQSPVPQKATSTQSTTVVEKKAEPQKSEPVSTESVKAEPVVSLPMLHKVKKGECLWKISSYKEIYNDPFMWPLIYKANKDKIKDPDLIFPGQMFSINRMFTTSEKNSAIHFAKTRGKWSLFDGK